MHRATRRLVLPVLTAELLALMPITISDVLAQPSGGGAQSSQLEEVVVTARKRQESALSVPVALSVFSGEQLEVLKVRDLTRLSTRLPGVLLDDVGTRRGTANFSIRGLGINSSIPSIDPTVGVFLNGIYLAVNNDTVFDIFDLERIEVLRGPQGVLFGRNVTGGALLLETRKPGNTASAAVRTAVEGGGEGGLSRYVMGHVEAPLHPTLSARLSVYHNDDQGWFENGFDGSTHGAVEQSMLRSTLLWQPGDQDQLTLFHERMRIDGDGPATQSHRNGAGIAGTPRSFPRSSFEFAIDEPGFQHVDSEMLSLHWERELGQGAGTLSYLVGWRQQASVGMSDIDGQPVFLFHSPGWVEAEQFSQELRINRGLGERVDLTAGLYQFSAQLAYHDRRLFLGDAGVRDSARATQDGGGRQNTQTKAAFAQADVILAPRWVGSVGLRAAREEKQARVASFNLNPTPCNIVLLGDCTFDFEDQAQFNTLSPQLGLRFMPDAVQQWRLQWTRSFRSGGYNLRNSNAAEAPGPFAEEQVDSLELGWRLQQRRWQWDMAAFATRVSDMQREVNLPNPSAGILQLVRNTADAEMIGLEFDGSLQLRPGLRLLGTLAWLDARYTAVSFDLNGDGRVDAADRNLDLPRAPQWTGGTGLAWQHSLPDGAVLSARAHYSYRDRVAYTDDNRGFILAQHLLDADVGYTSMNGHWRFSAYARNLLNEVKHGGDSQLPALFIGQPLGGTFAPLARGRLLGIEFEWRWAGA